ncbi:MAG: CoB--CoM heterodisulfide reductase subunit B [Thermoplasmata archaeon]|nr:CoB--CoM heterodisulfide reductase subunit B [Thermoplasmata archaeon]MCJ7562673.1 heterodisulfide reductase-related iron-sulfur binding cluster [Thermoplasmata archaeon]
MTPYAYFFGCVIPNRYPGIEYAVRWVCGKEGFDLDVMDMPEFSCCPVPGIFYSTDKNTWLLLAARNLVLAQEERRDIMTVCNGCLTSLLKATEYLQDPKAMGRVNRVLAQIGKKYTGVPRKTEGRRKIFEPVKVRHYIDVMARDIGLEAIASKVKKPLNNITVAVHYGCHYLRPTENQTIDDPNNPVLLDQIVEACGATSVDYEDKLDCCGAGGGVRSHVVDLANSLTEDKCKNISAVGADCIVTGCPFCLLQFDNAQKTFTKDGIPVMHVSQLQALSMGIDPISLGFDTHHVSAHSLLRKLRGA